MLKQSAAQSYLPGADKKLIFFKFFYVHSATNRESHYNQAVLRIHVVI